MKENNDLDDAYASASVFDFFCEDEDEDYDDEGSLEHFDRYIAGDR
jgi:hypothetical protein